jgi:hypothetical protein
MSLTELSAGRESARMQDTGQTKGNVYRKTSTCKIHRKKLIKLVQTRKINDCIVTSSSDYKRGLDC